MSKILVMKKEELSEIDKSEFEDVLRSVKIDLRLTKTILLFFIATSFFFKYYFQLSISLIIPAVLFVWFLIYLFNEYFLTKIKSISQIYNLYFRSLLIEVFLLTIIVYFLGSVEWIGGVFYILIISLSTVILPKEKTKILAIVTIFLYLSLVAFEFFQIIPHQTLFPEQKDLNLYLNPTYVFATSMSLVILILSFVGVMGSFSETLKEKRKDLMKAQEKAEEAKSVLEIKVAARTKELEFLTKNLEGEVKERTEELEKKIAELEKINKLMMGRELKMVELKRKIRAIEKKTEELKKKDE